MMALFEGAPELRPAAPRKGFARRFRVVEEAVDAFDQTVRVCPMCHGPLGWRYRDGVAWDRGLPVCATHGLLQHWHVISRDGRRLLAVGRVDNKGRVFARPIDLQARPVRPRRPVNVKHHYKPRPPAGPRLFDVSLRALGAPVGRPMWVEALDEVSPRPTLTAEATCPIPAPTLADLIVEVRQSSQQKAKAVLAKAKEVHV